MRIKYLLLVAGTFLLVFFMKTIEVSASSYQVNYTIEKYGTSQTSIADAYFVKPATVSVGQGQYNVSITIKTSHDLGSFPVQILNINGQGPQVSKSTSGNADYYTFSFTTKSVKQSMSGNMKVDIDSMDYHHTYGFTLLMNGGSVPELTSSSSSVSQQSTAQSTVASSKQTNSSTSSGSAANKTASSNSTSSTVATTSSSSVSIESSATTSNISSKSTSKTASKKENNSKKTKDKEDKTKKNKNKKKENKNNKSKSGNKSVLGFSITAILIGGCVGAWGLIHHYKI
ncbi:NEAT domain-containing protein [Liquorilactobacillus mali]|uniref:NEAT domain-containing protein n=1 Tax=Liquorilactobacillus mali TaxID=1618 RepID=UPI002350E1CE|nr:NEAT domain-containing protein [Liquorilactobacillus mali]MDC7952904.1 NEAT domain-containing protein [Liquorilactobacillus mali]